MLSKVKCVKCKERMNFQSDVHGAYFSCAKCGSERGAICPHCHTDSIMFGSSPIGREIACRVCGCRNGDFAKACERNFQPGVIMA